MTRIDVKYNNLSGGKNALLFLPPFVATKEIYVNQYKVLDEHGIPYVAIDYPGIGNSENPPKEDLNISEMVNIIYENIKGLPFKKVIPLGTSMGGYVMLEFWRQHKYIVAGMVFCNTRAQALDEEGKKKRLGDIEKVRENKEKYVKEFFANLVSEETKRKRAGIQDFIDRIISHGSVEGIVAEIYTIATRPDYTGILKDIDVPVLVIAGGKDRVVPLDVMEGMAKSIKDSVFVVFDESGHLSAIEEPEEFNNVLLSFLKDKGLI
jgi:pimeloyl-ACP methyl ester carboxylesterase